MLQEVVTQAFVVVGALDDSRQVREHDTRVVDKLNLADVWSQSREWVVRYLRESPR
jgi:hypothetical protein